MQRSALLMMGLALSGLVCSGCRIVNGKVDTSWVSDRVSPAQNDEVTIEQGQGLSSPRAAVASTEQAPVQGAAPAQKGVWSQIQENTVGKLHGMQQQNNPQPQATQHATGVAPTALPTPEYSNPAPAQTTAPATHSVSYTVRKGDTLSSLAQRYHSSVASISAANGLSSSNIRIGQTLNIPTGSSTTSSSAKTAAKAPAKAVQATAAKKGRYIVKAGDSYSSIAKKQHLSMDALLKANGKTRSSGAKIKPGDSLIIPAHP